MTAHALPGQRPRGFSLVEVLVVILVMSFGLLGIASLQANTAKYKVNSWARAAAAVQFSDLADRIRANTSQGGARFNPVAAAGVASAYQVSDTFATQQAADFTPPDDCLAVSCTDVQRAAYDMAVWRAEVRRQFPQGAVSVVGGLAAGYTATVAWFDRQFVDAAGALANADTCPTTAGGIAAATPAALANCCPASLAAPGGVRCANVSFIP